MTRVPLCARVVTATIERERNCKSSPSDVFDRGLVRCFTSRRGETPAPKRASRPPQVHTDAFPTPMEVSMQTVAVVRSPYKERFGCPRQPTVTQGVVGGEAGAGFLELVPSEHNPEEKLRMALRELSGFEFIWVISYLHMNEGWSASVTPPRGPRRKRGLFATRAPHRPNHVGLSACRLMDVDEANLKVSVHGLDLLDGTPVLDIKPYVPYCDSFAGARAGWLEEIDEANERDHLAYWPCPAAFLKCKCTGDFVKLRGSQVAQLPPARGDASLDLPSAVLSVHTAFWLTPIVAILVYILEVGLTWRALAMGVAAMSIFVALFVIVILLAPQLGCYALSSSLQVSLLQHPGCPLSQMVLPAIGSAQGMELCNNAYCHRLRDALGNNYCYAGMVSIGDYQVVEATLRSGQSRTALLGAQALTNLPKVDRDIFFLQMPNLDVNSLHERFVACFKHYMFSEGFAERMKSEKAARLWAQLAEDYRRMPHGLGEEFHKASDKGLRGFFIRYFFYVMIGLDPEDPEVMRALVPLMQGDTPIGFAYLWPMARLGILNGYINEIDSRIYNSPALSDFIEGEECYGKMSKLELSRLTTCIFRLAAITGTLQLAKSITGGLQLPNYKDMDKIDIPSQWDKLDLKDDVALQNFCYEVGGRVKSATHDFLQIIGSQMA
ncbi:trmO [Symbiodinium sp. CCMP2592]|nr:trmO [Symbiodinium sp. CCMP2592]